MPKNPEIRKEHLASRLRQCFKHHNALATEDFHRKNGSGEIPVLIGKHFIWVFLREVAKHEIGPLQNFDLVMAGNPEEPSQQFQQEWGSFLDAMTKDLEAIGAKLSGPQGADDYVIWKHQKSATESDNPDETHVSIFAPHEFRQAKDFDELFALTKLRIAKMINE